MKLNDGELLLLSYEDGDSDNHQGLFDSYYKMYRYIASQYNPEELKEEIKNYYFCIVSINKEYLNNLVWENVNIKNIPRIMSEEDWLNGIK